MNPAIQELLRLLATAVIEQLIAEQSEGNSKTEPADNPNHCRAVHLKKEINET